MSLFTGRNVPLSRTVVVFLLLWGLFAAVIGGLSRQERERRLPDLFRFPYKGRGEPIISFHRPYEPDEDGDAVSGWLQLGSTTVTSDPQGRDIVRLTTFAQANQGLFYAYTKTQTNNFNGYFDIQMNTSPESHEPADGMALFFTSERPVIGSAMGMSHTLRGLGIVIDTFSNSRTRHVPYLYAYVSDGKKEWNPDTDGEHNQLAKGCRLEMNRPIRVYIQFVDGTLSIGVSMTPHKPDNWHMCFKVDRVQLPFSDGGYLAFAGETGHFFAAHEVHNAAFLAERQEHHYNADYDRYHSQYHREDVSQRNHEHDRWPEDLHRRRDPPSRHEDVKHSEKRDHRSGDALSGSLDRQVSDVFNSLSEHMRGFSDRDAEDTRQRLNGVKDMTAHLLVEVARQKEDMISAIDTLKSLKRSASDLRYSTDRFMGHIKTMHESMEALRTRTGELEQSHDDMHLDLMHHSDKLSGHGEGSTIILFLCVQALLVTVGYFISRMTTPAKKAGRMV